MDGRDQSCTCCAMASSWFPSQAIDVLLKKRQSMTSKTTSSLIPAIEAAWRQHGIELRSGVVARQIEAFERSYAVRLSSDVSEYFRAVDGMNENETDHHGIRFWTLTEVRP